MYLNISGLIVKNLALSQSVADFERAGVGNTNDVAGERFVDNALFLSHKGGRRGETQGFARADVAIRGVALELAGTYLYERDTRTVVRVHIGMNLEHEAAELLLGRLNAALFGIDGFRRGRNLNEAVEQLLYAKGVECRTEENRRNQAGAIVLNIKFGINALDKLQVIAQLLGIGRAYGLVDSRVVDIVDFNALADLLLVGGEEVERMFVDIINALELGADIDGPRKGANRDFQLCFQLVENLEGVPTLAVQLVNEDDNGSVAHAAHLHQAARLLLNALCTVNDDDYRVNRR